MGKREEITDLIKPEAFDDPKFKKGLLLKFTKASIVITRVDRKNKRVWGEHQKTYEFNTAISHYGHNVEKNDDGSAYCNDCMTEIDQAATEEGEVKAIQRQKEQEDEEEAAQAPINKKRRFRYELLKQDGTIKHFAKQKRKKAVEVAKILGARKLGVVPMAYYPQKYGEAALYSDQDVDFDANVKNPHLNTLQGDPDLGEEKEYYIVGDVLAEIEV